MVATATDMGILTHHLHPSSLGRRTHLYAMTIMDTLMINTIAVIHILFGHTLIPQLQNPTLTHIQTHIHSLIHIRTPHLLRSNNLLRGGTFTRRPLTITPILNLLHALTLILLITSPWMQTTPTRTPVHIPTRQR